MGSWNRRFETCLDTQGGPFFTKLLVQKRWAAISELDRVKRTWYLSLMRAAKVQASLRIRAVSPEPSLLAYTSSESRGTFRQKARSQAPLNGWAWAVKICHDGMLEDTNSLDGAQILLQNNMAVVFNNYIVCFECMSFLFYKTATVSIIYEQSSYTQNQKLLGSFYYLFRFD